MTCHLRNFGNTRVKFSYTTKFANLGERQNQTINSQISFYIIPVIFIAVGRKISWGRSEGGFALTVYQIHPNKDRRNDTLISAITSYLLQIFFIRDLHRRSLYLLA